MSGPTILEYRDRGVGLQPAPTDDVPAGSPLWQVAGQLMDGLISQLPGALDTCRHPVWSLHRTEAAGESYWCFAVQAGMNGALGAAGGCQFAFVPGDWLPARAWNTCIRHVEGGQLIRHPSGTSAFPPATARPHRPAVEQVVYALLRNQERIAVPSDPEEAAELFSAIFRVLPAGVVGRYLWSTCLLRPAYGHSQPVVAGRWPEEFRRLDPRGARQVEDWLRPRGGTSAYSGAYSGASGREQEAADWLVREMTTKGLRDAFAPTAHAEVDTVADLLTVVVREHLPISVADVPRLLESDEGRRRLLLTAPELARDWAKADPERARSRLTQTALPAELERGLLQGLMARSVTTGRDELRLPDESSVDRAWGLLLGQLLPRHVPADELAEWVRPLYGKDRTALVGRRAILERAGLSRERHPEFFPTDIDGIARGLANGRGLPEWARAELQRSADPVREVAAVIERLRPEAILPGDAARLLAIADSADAGSAGVARLVEQVVARRWAEGPADAAEWTDRLRDEAAYLGASGLVGAVCAAALTALTRYGLDPTQDDELVTALRFMAAHPARSPAELTVLRTAQRRLEQHRKRRRRWRRRRQADGSPAQLRPDAGNQEPRPTPHSRTPSGAPAWSAHDEPPPRTAVSLTAWLLWVTAALVVMAVLIVLAVLR